MAKICHGLVLFFALVLGGCTADISPAGTPANNRTGVRFVGSPATNFPPLPPPSSIVRRSGVGEFYRILTKDYTSIPIDGGLLLRRDTPPPHIHEHTAELCRDRDFFLSQSYPEFLQPVFIGGITATRLLLVPPEFVPDEFIYPLQNETDWFVERWTNYSACHCESPYSRCYSYSKHAKDPVLDILWSLFAMVGGLLICAYNSNARMLCHRTALANMIYQAASSTSGDNGVFDGLEERFRKVKTKVSSVFDGRTKREILVMLDDVLRTAPKLTPDEVFEAHARGSGGLYEVLGLKPGDATDWAHDIAMLVMGLTLAKREVDVALAFAHFLDTRIVRSETTLADFTSQLLARVTILLGRGQSVETWEMWEPQGVYDDFVGATTRMSNLIKGERGSRILQALVVVVSAASFVSSGSLDIARLDFVRKLWTDGVTMADNMDMLTTCVETIKWITTAGWQAYQTGCTDSFFVGGSSMTKWVSEVELCLATKDNLSHLTTYVNMLDMTRHEQIKDLPSLRQILVRLLDESATIKKVLIIKQKKASVRVVDDYTTRLRSLLCEVELRLKSALTRPAAFGIVVYGFTSIRKTTIIDLTTKVAKDIAGIPDEGAHVYYRNPYDEYWSGLENNTGSIIILDDIACERAEKAVGISPGVQDLLMVINNVPYCPAMAEARDKGKISLSPAAVFATTNNLDMNFSHYFHMPAAAHRRFPYVLKATVKREFATEATRNEPADKRMLDPRFQVDDDELPDYWNFEVLMVSGMTKTLATKYVTVLDTTKNERVRAIDQWLEFYAEKFKEHLDGQNNYMRFRDSLSSRKFCTNCRRLNIHPCPCTRDSPMAFSSASSAVGACDIQELGDDGYESQGAEQFILKVIGFLTVLRLLSVYCPRVAMCCYRLVRRVYGVVRARAVGYGRSVVAGFVDMVGDEVSARFQLVSPAQLLRHVGRQFDDARPYLVVSLAAAVAVGAVYSAYQYLCATKYGPHAHEDYPNLRTDHEPNAWLVPRATPAVGARSATSRGSVGKEGVIASTLRNLVRLSVRYVKPGTDDIVEYSMYGFGVHGSVVVTNAHFFRRADGTLRTIEDPKHLEPVYRITMESRGAGKVTTTHRMDVPISDVRFAEGSDLAAFRCRSRDFRSIISQSGSILAKDKVTKSDGFYLEPDGAREVLFEIGTTPRQTIGFHVIQSESYLVRVKPGSESMFRGDCGLPLFAYGVGGAPVLVGLHCAGVASDSGSSMALSVPITHDMIKDLVGGMTGIRAAPDGFVDHTYMEPGDLRTGEPVFDGTQFIAQERVRVGDLHPKSIFQHDHDDGIDGPYEVVGGLHSVGKGGVVSRMLSTEHKGEASDTLLTDDLKRAGFDPGHCAPNMSGYKPQRNMAKRMRSEFIGCDEILTMCALAFCSDIEGRLGDAAEGTCGKLTDVDNMNGIPGSRLPPIDRSKSSGAHTYGPKRNLCVSVSDNLTDERVLPNDSVMEDVRDIESNYAGGRTSGCLWTITWKAELVSFAKRAADKTRGIFFAPFALLFVTRRYFGALGALIQGNGFAFETAWGVNATGRDWQRIYDHVCQFGTDRILAGDYVAYDLSAYTMHSLMLCFMVLIHLNMKFSNSFTARDEMMMWGIAYDSVSYYVNFFGTLLRMCGILPSGHGLTTVINGMHGSILARAGWVVADVTHRAVPLTRAEVRHSLERFSRCVALITYGDDHIAGIHESVTWFTASTFAAGLSAFAIDYTGTIKDAPIPNVLAHITSETFLKRGFLLVGADFVRAPLDIKSLVRSGLATLERTLPPYLYAIEVVKNMHAGAAQHSREVFDKFDVLCRSIAARLSLGCESEFDTYEGYYARCYGIASGD